jgi:hypothetical protein
MAPTLATFLTPLAAIFATLAPIFTTLASIFTAVLATVLATVITAVTPAISRRRGATDQQHEHCYQSLGAHLSSDERTRRLSRTDLGGHGPM